MTAYGPERRRRQSTRLQGYDYSRRGAYFVTICVQDRACLFGEVVGDEMRLGDLGTIADACWRAIPDHVPHVELDAFVVMPNHIHGILVLAADVAWASQPRFERFARPVSGSIPTVVRSFKSAVTRGINARRGTPGAPTWQRNYYEHVIRDEADLYRIRQYIADNPARWSVDRENPRRLRPNRTWFGTLEGAARAPAA